MTVLVTGARGGIGQGVVEALRARGERVLAHDLVGADGAVDGVTHVTGDVCDVADILRLVGEQPLRAAIVAHGVQAPGELRASDDPGVRRAMDVDFVAVAELFDALLEHLAAARGAFVAISSQAGLVAEPANGVYGAAKFALVGWGRAVAARAARRGVRVRVLCPGSTETPALEDYLTAQGERLGQSYDRVKQDWVRDIPLGRTATPREMGEAAVWLSELEAPRGVVAAITGGQVRW